MIHNAECHKPEGDTPCTAVAVTRNIVGNVLTPADLNALDNLIQTLGDKSTNLSDTEKAGAIAVIDEWNTSVTARIHANAQHARDVLSFLDGADMYGRMLDDIIEMFHDAIGDTPEYLAYRQAVDAYADVQRDAPLEIPIQNDTTVAHADKIHMENYANSLEHQRRLKTAKHAFDKAVKTYIKSLNAMDGINTVRANLTRYKNKASRMAADCADKATRAKLNVTISDPDVRSVLHDMMDFAKKV